MEVGIKYDNMDNEIYEINKTQLVIRDEKFKLYQLVEGSYEFQGEVLKKDYRPSVVFLRFGTNHQSKSIKSMGTHYLRVSFFLGTFPVVTELINIIDYSKI